MEAAGHEPDVFYEDKTDYYFGTCSKESPQSARNCVYDKETADHFRKNYPELEFDGSAVEMAKAMGIILMTIEHYQEILQQKRFFDKETVSWLSESNQGLSCIGYRKGSDVETYVSVPNDYEKDRGWRGSLRVKKVSA